MNHFGPQLLLRKLEVNLRPISNPTQEAQSAQLASTFATPDLWSAQLFDFFGIR